MSSNISLKKICEHCEKVFIAKKTKTRFCSHRCNSPAYKLKVKQEKIGQSNDDAKTQILKTIQPSEKEISVAKELVNIRDNASVVFDVPYNMVLSETVARKYFGPTDCLGKTLTLDKHINATVTGVIKDIPRNSHFRTDILLSMSSLI